MRTSILAVAAGACLWLGMPEASLAQELPESIRAYSAVEVSGLKATIRTQAKQLKVSEAALWSIAGTFGADFKGKDFQTFVTFMESKAKELRGLLDELGTLKAQLSARPDTQKALGEAYQLIEQGRLDEAQAAIAALTPATEAALGLGVDNWLDLNEAYARVLTLRGKAIEAAQIRDKAIQHYDDTVAQAQKKVLQMAINSAMDLYNQGDLLGDNAALELSIDVFRRKVLARMSRRESPALWAAMQNNLGNALQTLGERESETVRIEEAVLVYKLALEERKRDQLPLDWASTQNSLGVALQTLGGLEGGTTRLEESILIFRSTLEERTRDRVPLSWAQTQMSLGNSLLTLGQREGGTSGLEEAVTAYKLALEELPRDSMPFEWAMVQNNLGISLSILGDREAGTARLAEAAIAYRSALEEWERNRVPLYWAMAQNNLGNALRILGGRENSTTRLEEAVAAYRWALEERRRGRVPLQWAMTQANLMLAYKGFFSQTQDRAHIATALAHGHAALEVFQDIKAEYYMDSCRKQISILEGL